MITNDPRKPKCNLGMLQTISETLTTLLAQRAMSKFITYGVNNNHVSRVDAMLSNREVRIKYDRSPSRLAVPEPSEVCDENVALADAFDDFGFDIDKLMAERDALESTDQYRDLDIIPPWCSDLWDAAVRKINTNLENMGTAMVRGGMYTVVRPGHDTKVGPLFAVCDFTLTEDDEGPANQENWLMALHRTYRMPAQTMIEWPDGATVFCHRNGRTP